MEDPAQVLAALNASPDGFTQAMGFAFIKASPTEVEIEWTVAKQHLQPYGIVHGGVHAGVVETVCSVGAGLAARERGLTGGVVGLENHTSFLRAVREGTKLRARAVPVTRGRTTQVWHAEVRDQANQLIATGSVRLLCTQAIGRDKT
ncbi:MAG TPA: PaaI family thioesterase [Polyangiales bacterium]|nr:PaaI family thioesterase [Polyangiales bacterium]